MKVAAIGDNCIDYYSDTKRYHVTGNALDFAVNMRKLGLPTSLISTTGKDKFGDETIRVLRNEDVNISHLKVGDGPTAISYMELIEKERTYGDYIEGVMEKVVFNTNDIEFAKEHDLVHSAIWGMADDYIEEISKSDTLISFDYATEFKDPIVEKTIPFVDYAFFSFEEKTADIEDFLKEMATKSSGTVIGTFGEKGSAAWDGKKWHEFGIIQCHSLVNTVGAGDSYIAGFMHAILNKKSISEAQEVGAELAAKVVSVFEPWTEYKGEIYDK